MKKTLVALAALAATSAFAQSTVEIYGIVDVGYSSHKIDNGAGAANSTTTRKNIGSNGQSTSRLGFRGTEDLGAGTKAGFTFETELTPAGNATGAATTAANGSTALSTFQNRQAFVSLGSEKSGTLAIGRQYSPAHVIQAAYNAGGANNVVGDVTYTQPEVGATAPTNGISGLRADVLNGPAYAIRASNAVSYVLPTFVPGLTTALAYVTTNTNNNGTDVGAKATTGFAKYDNGPLSLGVSYLKGTYKNTTVGAADIATGAAGQGNTQAPDTKATNSVYGVSYAVANANVYYSRTDLKLENDATFDKRVANKVGVNATFGAWVPFVQYGTAKITDETATGGGNLKGYQVGTSYLFSKRTNAYAIYGSNKVSSLNDPASTASPKETQLAIGLRHQF